MINWLRLCDSGIQKLDLGKNALAVVTISNMFKLQTVDLSHNQIAEFPTMKNLPNLNTLNLSNNRICDLPNGYNFPKLVNLNLAHNGISKVPPQIFSETILTNLLLTGNTVS